MTVAVTSAPFEQVARDVAQRAAEMLCARVSVLDERGAMIAAAEPGVGLTSLADAWIEECCIQAPIQYAGQSGQVLIAEPADGEVISPRLARVIIDMAMNQSVVVGRLPNQAELKNRFIFDLLRGPGADEADTLREGEILGMDFTRPRAVVLIDASDYIMVSSPRDPGERMRRSALRAQHVIASVVSYFRLPNDAICGYIGDGEVAVLKASAAQDLIMWTDGGIDPNPSWANLTALKRACSGLAGRLRKDTATHIRLGIGRYHPGMRGLARSYQDASAALSLGRRFAPPASQVHCLDDLGVAAFMGVPDERTKIDLASQLLSPLDGEPELLDTIRALFEESFCVQTTASRLSIHRNTLTYRLDKITLLIGLDPRHFDDAVQIRLALVLRSL